MKRVDVYRRWFTTIKGRKFQVTYFSIAGTKPGPVLTIISGQHGMEHSGPNLLPELIEELSHADFAGTVNVCPCANPLALEIDYEFYPENEDLSKIKDYYYSIFRHYYCPWGFGRNDSKTMYNMNRLWNRNEIHGVAGEITEWLWDSICCKADMIIDMHGLQAAKPLVFCNRDKNLPLAGYCGIEAVVMTNPAANEYRAGNLTWQGGIAEGQYAICIEFSCQHGLKESEYELGKKAVRNVMIGARMLAGEVSHSHPVWKVPLNNSGSDMIARSGGHIRYSVELYDYVHKGDKVYEIRDLQTVELLEEGFAPNDGLVHDITHLPVIRPADKICFVAEAEILTKPGEILEKLPADFFRKYASVDS